MFTFIQLNLPLDWFYLWNIIRVELKSGVAHVSYGHWLSHLRAYAQERSDGLSN